MISQKNELQLRPLIFQKNLTDGIVQTIIEIIFKPDYNIKTIIITITTNVSKY